MLRKLAVLAVLAVTNVALLTAVATAGQATAKQRVALELRNNSFVLTSLTAGALKRDTGAMSACCWTRRFVTRDGESIEVNNPKLTLTGGNGTLVLRNRIEWVDLPDGWAIFTGTWKVVRGTGAYAGVSGGGRLGGSAPNESTTKARLEGFLSPR